MKRLGHGDKTYGEIKALAQSFHKHKVVGLHGRDIDRAVEAHLHKIELAKTSKKKYNRKKAKKVEE